MVGLSDRKLVQEQASLAGFRLEEAAVKLLVQWLQNGADGEEQLQALFNMVDTGGDCGKTMPPLNGRRRASALHIAKEPAAGADWHGGH